MLSTRVRKNNIDRDHSWKRLLRISDKEWAKRQGYVKKVFDDSHFDAENVVSSLQFICDTALNDPNLKPWKKLFIRYKELFVELNQGFIFKNGDEIFLLNESQRNHTHSELYSKVLEFKLKPEIALFKPFTDISYQSVVGVEKKPFVALSKYFYQGKSYVIHVQFSDGEYRLSFQSCNYEDYSKELLDIVVRHGFRQKEKNDFFYRYNCKTSAEVFEKLKDICSDLRGLLNE